MPRDHRGYLQRVSALWALWGLLPSTWQTAAVAVVSAVTAYLGFQSGGLFYAVLGAVFVFCLGMVGMFFAILVSRQVGIFGKLLIREIGISEVAVDLHQNVMREIKALTMNFTVQNNSARDIYFRVIRAPLSIMNHVNQAAGISNATNIVPAGQTQLVLLATIQHIKAKIVFGKAAPTPITGKLELEIAYGPSDEKLRYILNYEGEPILGMGLLPQPKGPPQVQFKLITPIKRYEHKKITS